MRPNRPAQVQLERKSQGVALLSVLLVVTIVLAVAARLMANHGLSISQNQNAFEQDQALQYVLGAEVLATQALVQDFQQTGEVDHLGEQWAQPVLPFDLDEGGFLEARVIDLQNCFNLNNLNGSNSDEVREQFKRMLRNLGAQPEIADRWKDWIDADNVVTDFGAEDSEYLLSDIPHRTPNTLVTDVSELAMLNSISQEEVALITPEVCALPATETRININTAGIQTLAAFSENVTPAQLEALVSQPREYTSVDQFINENPDFQSADAVLGVGSQYFQVQAYAEVGDSSVSLQSLLQRDTSSGQITVLSRNFGKLFRSSLEVEISEES